MTSSPPLDLNELALQVAQSIGSGQVSPQVSTQLRAGLPDVAHLRYDASIASASAARIGWPQTYLCLTHHVWQDLAYARAPGPGAPLTELARSVGVKADVEGRLVAELGNLLEPGLKSLALLTPGDTSIPDTSGQGWEPSHQGITWHMPLPSIPEPCPSGTDLLVGTRSS